MGTTAGIRRISVRTVLIGVYATITIIMLTGYLLSYNLRNTTTEEYEHFMEISRTLSEITLVVNECEYHYNRYLRERTEEDLQSYSTKAKNIERNLTNIAEALQEYPETLAYHRTFYNMNEYQYHKIMEIARIPALTAEDYQDLTYVATLFQYMKQQSQELMVSYLNFGNERYSNLLEEAQRLERRVHSSMFLLAFMSIWLGMILSRGILQKIKQISKASQKLSEGHWEMQDIKSDRYIELHAMAHAFNNMKKDIKRYIEEQQSKAQLEKQLVEERLLVEQQDKLLKEAKLLTLQMQMNPHFLFNTLNMIRRVIQLQEKDTAVSLVGAISDILRYNLDNRGRLVPLSDEIRTLEAYNLIQQVRFQDRLCVKLNVCGNLEDITVPPLILQPMVENAIVHGLADRNSGGIIEIDVARGATEVIVRIQDNGRGISKERMQEVMHSNLNENSQSIGIMNVRNRLELQYGRQDLFRIESEENKGTRITIVIPIKRGMV
ncbi:sensor histidine kinase [Anaerotalea alkaliphila]|uniref:histidine kinase n=1 Tax=Anaerotalea alkaliphila TaxID=2662126 RepID=A0A7X5HXX3_9FIRM|nr:histidine kinase [Anaerotalea alkaliphila]NDL68546.1 hypothetical protein [Anaerotalea alkaliphila]